MNSYLIEEGGEVTIIDAGIAGQYADLATELAAMGRTLDDVRAVVLTHGHGDRIGYAERIRRERQVPVSVHELDAALARGEVPNPAKGFGPVGVGPLLRFLWYTGRKGGLRQTPLTEVATFGDGATLDVPGAPQVILVPGHTPGSAALHVATRGALFVGDALATLAVTTGKTGPRVAPFAADAATALRSLDRLAGLDAGLVLPGHGDVARRDRRSDAPGPGASDDELAGRRDLSRPAPLRPPLPRPPRSTARAPPGPSQVPPAAAPFATRWYSISRSAPSIRRKRSVASSRPALRNCDQSASTSASAVVSAGFENSSTVRPRPARRAPRRSPASEGLTSTNRRRSSRMAQGCSPTFHQRSAGRALP